MKHAAITFTAAVALLAFCHQANAQGTSPVDQIEAIAAGSECASVDWNDRGEAPSAYIRRVALVFARAVCQPERPDAKVVSAARGAPGTGAERTDALAWYDSKFRELGMPNANDGVDTLRHAYALLIGLGMRESSGEYCTGRDRGADFNSADSAEAGLFQTSWGASKTHPTLPELFNHYSSGQTGCLLDVFSRHVTCSAWDARTWGEGKGADWQKLTKACPAFATEYGAVLIRTSGGRKGEFGPLRNKRAEVRPECDAMLSKVQALVQTHPEMCSSLK
jgi:hypothetical protein